MYWINLPALESQIIDSRLTDRNALSYFIANAILIGIILNLSDDDTLKGLYVLGIIPLLLIIYWGVSINFSTYTKHKGKDFFKVYWAIAWVVGIRIFLALLILLFTLAPLIAYLMLNLSYLESITTIDMAKNKQNINLITNMITTSLTYFFINRSLKRIALGQPLNKWL